MLRVGARTIKIESYLALKIAKRGKQTWIANCGKQQLKARYPLIESLDSQVKRIAIGG